MTSSMEQTAQDFFQACEAGKGWEACATYEGDKISHMTKIWHSGIAMQQLGWV